MPWDPLFSETAFFLLISTTLYHTIRYGRFMCAQKLTRWPA